MTKITLVEIHQILKGVPGWNMILSVNESKEGEPLLSLGEGDWFTLLPYCWNPS